jgi:hypothetical protein
MRNRIHFDERASRQCGNTDRRARRIRLREVLRHDFIDRREVPQIGQVYAQADDIVQRSARCLGHGRQIPEYTIDLHGRVLSDEFHRFWIQWNLAREIHHFAHADSLGIRADRRWCTVRANRSLHKTVDTLINASCE